MLKENAFVLVSASTNEYVGFIGLLKENFKALEIHSEEKALTGSIEHLLLEGTGADNGLFILFVEFPYLNSVSRYLSKRLNPLNYILVAFYPRHQMIDNTCGNVWEFVSTGPSAFDGNYFFHKLRGEISNKQRISFLQSEVREFYEIGKSLSSEKDTVKLFEMIINSSINMTASDAGTIYLVVDSESGNWSSIRNNDYQGRLLKFIIAKNMSMDVNLQASTSPITRESISGYTVITGKPLRIDDAYRLDPGLDYHHDRRFDQSTGYITQSILSIPMKDHEDNVMGVIQLINKKRLKNERLDYTSGLALKSILPYDYTDEMIMNSLAGQAAIALENNLLYRDMHSLLQSYKEQNSQLELLTRKILRAHEEERKRIAREIHDGPAQSVVNLSLKVELCKKYYNNNDAEKFLNGLNDLSSSVRFTAKEIRTIIYDLKPSYLEDGLLKALENHFNVFMDNTGIKVIFITSNADTQVEYYMASAIYRVVQEALTNIYKHAEADTVTVDFSTDGDRLFIVITDNGKGFDTSKLESKKNHRLDGGFGLEGMKERIELMKGTMLIKSAPGEGTSISINIPLVYSANT